MNNSKINEDKERVDFENAYNALRTHPEAKKQLEIKGDKYTYSHIETAWQLWLVRAKLANE